MRNCSFLVNELTSVRFLILVQFFTLMIIEIVHKEYQKSEIIDIPNKSEGYRLSDEALFNPELCVACRFL